MWKITLIFSLLMLFQYWSFNDYKKLCLFYTGQVKYFKKQSTVVKSSKPSCITIVSRVSSNNNSTRFNSAQTTWFFSTKNTLSGHKRFKGTSWHRAQLRFKYQTVTFRLSSASQSTAPTTTDQITACCNFLVTSRPSSNVLSSLLMLLSSGCSMQMCLFKMYLSMVFIDNEIVTSNH